MSRTPFDKLADKAFKRVRDTFSTKVEWLPKKGGRYQFYGIFSDGVLMIDPDTEVRVSTNTFTLGFRYADLPAIPVSGDIAIINKKRYRVYDIQEDGVEGVSGVLYLHRVER